MKSKVGQFTINNPPQGQFTVGQLTTNNSPQKQFTARAIYVNSPQDSIPQRKFIARRFTAEKSKVGKFTTKCFHLVFINF
jgi:hypothetical protein